MATLNGSAFQIRRVPIVMIGARLRVGFLVYTTFTRLSTDKRPAQALLAFQLASFLLHPPL